MTLVLDSGAFIAGTKLDRFGPDAKYYTIPEVVAEIKDEASKRLLETFPYHLEQQRQVSAAAIQAVCDFSKKTGDFHYLSKVDLKVLAVAYMLHVEQHGSDTLRTTPLRQVPRHKSPSSSSSSSSTSTGESWNTFKVNPFSLDDVLFMDNEKCMNTLLSASALNDFQMFAF